MCKKYKIPLKNHFDELEKNPILKNCSIDLKYNIGTPPCPLQPYKKNFLEIKSKSTYLKSNKSLSNKSLSISRNKTKKNKSF